MDGLEDILLALLEFLFEVVLEVVGEALFGLVLRALGTLFERLEFEKPVSAAIGYTILGAFTGGASVLIFPHPLIRTSRLHGISLLISPLATGAIMSLIGSVLRRRGKGTVQIETFWYGFAFAFGIALVRLLFVAWNFLRRICAAKSRVVIKVVLRARAVRTVGIKMFDRVGAPTARCPPGKRKPSF